MLPFLKAPADAPLMTDKHEIDARYRYWRRHILLTIWLGYALFYFTRKSFNAAVFFRHHITGHLRNLGV